MERTDLPWPQKRDASFPNSHDITRNERSAECIMRDVIHRWKSVESEKPVSSIHNPAKILFSYYRDEYLFRERSLSIIIDS